jgi:hypothetical protein
VWIYLETSRLEVKQLKYSAFDRELLAAFLSVRHIRYLLDGRRFHILTDHKPLTQALYRVSDPWTARVQRQLAFLAELTSDVRHNPGKVNVIADALSRPPPSVVADEKEPIGSSATAWRGGKPKPTPPSSSPPAAAAQGASATSATLASSCSGPLPSSPSPPAAAARVASATSAVPASALYSGDFAAMAAAQWTCEDTQEIISKSSLKIKFFPTTGKDLACDVSQVTARPVVPVSFRKQVFSSIHNITHPGIRARKQLISVRFVWRKMGSQIAELCRDCQSCARSKTTTTVHSSVQPIEMPAKRFSHVHIDLVGPLPAYQPPAWDTLTCSQWWTGVPGGRRPFC